MSTISRRPPGARTRPASASARAGSGRWCSTSASTATSSCPRRSAGPRARRAGPRHCRWPAGPAPPAACRPIRRRRSPSRRAGPGAHSTGRCRSPDRRPAGRRRAAPARRGRGRPGRRESARSLSHWPDAFEKNASEVERRCSSTPLRRRSSCSATLAQADLLADQRPETRAPTIPAAGSDRRSARCRRVARFTQPPSASVLR